MHENDGDYCLSADHMLNAPDDCMLHISWLLSAIRHREIPHNVLMKQRCCQVAAEVMAAACVWSKH